MLGYLNATLEGVPTIKAFGAEKIVTKEFETHHNLFNSASYSYTATLKAFVFVADVFASFFVAVVILQFVIFDRGIFFFSITPILSKNYRRATWKLWIGNFTVLRNL